MDDLGNIHQLVIYVFGCRFSFNLEVIISTFVVMFIIVSFSFLSVKNSGVIPNSFQVLAESLVTRLNLLTQDALGEKMAKTYFPLISALFIFLILSNWIGIFPLLEEPTKDLNTPLSLGVIGFFIAHYVGIKTKGFKKYAGEYFEPFFIMMPLNLIGELAKIVSISFRLFGNIMGGSIIILVVSHLTYSLVLPPFLNAFFGLFVGAIQAFVFTMLTIVYISVQAK